MDINTETEKRLWFVFCNDQLLVEKNNGRLSIPYQNEPPTPINQWTRVHELSMFDGEVFNAYSIDKPVQENDHYTMIGLRASFDILIRSQYQKAGKAHELIYWDKNSHYCPVCGMPMTFNSAISKICNNCGKEIWPTVATAIIVLIQKEDQILLVHAKNFRGDYYGLVAGFVETGETLEECVEREVMEETGLKIKNIKYFASQAWPYPCGLMVGFTAEYESGEIKLQASELSAGNFFTKENMPNIPGKVSLARMLIDHWLEKQSRQETNNKPDFQ